MGTIHKTDTTKSPLLQPVIQRDYTKGLDFNGPETKVPGPAQPIQPAQPAPGQPAQPGPGAAAEKPTPNYNSAPLEDDSTKPFSFDEETGNPSDLAEGEDKPFSLPTGSARTFANTIGNIVQQQLPKALYGYVKIDINDVRMNVEAGILTPNWIETFEKINQTSKEALKLSDETMKMWKSAFQHYLEYEQISFANPKTEFFIATATVLTELGIIAYTINKTNKAHMRKAIEICQPGLLVNKSNLVNNQEPQINANDESRAA